MTQGLSPLPPRHFAAPVIPQDRPVYRVGQGGFFGPDDHLWVEGSIIAWDEIPSVNMEPLNQLAENNFAARLAELDKYGRLVAEKTGKSYVSLADAFTNAHALAKQEGRRVEAIGQQELVPLMGAKKRGRPKIQKIDLAASGPTAPLGVPKKPDFSEQRLAANKTLDTGL